MHANTLISLKPSAYNVEALQAALDRIAAEANTTIARIKDLTARIEASAMILTSKERRALADDLSDAEQDVKQLEAIAEATRAAIAAAQHNAAREAAATSHAALVARLADHEASFLDRYRAHEIAIRKILDERAEIATAITAHNDGARVFRELRISGVDELMTPALMTRFFQTEQELSAIRNAEQARRQEENFERQKIRDERYREQVAYAASRMDAPAPIVTTHSPAGRMVQRG